MSSQLSLLAKAILLLNSSQNLLPPSIADELRSLCPEPVVEPVAEPVAEPVVEPVAEPVAEPVKPKKSRQTKAAAAKAATPAPAPAPVAAPEPQTNWRDHPSRLKPADIKTTNCLGRKLDLNNPLPGTKETAGMIFPERQCTKKPVPGSKLCASCGERDAEAKANPNKNNGQWHGRLDEETLYSRAKIVGSALFLARYPNGLPNSTSEPVKSNKLVVNDTVATDTAPVEALWKSFHHEGRTHIRNLKTNKVYFANLNASSPEQNAIKEQYVGKWVDGTVELIDDSDDE